MLPAAASKFSALGPISAYSEMFAKCMYTCLHANGCNFMTHYASRTNEESWGRLDSELACVCQLSRFDHQPEALSEDKNALRCPEILTEHILCARQFPRSGTRDVNKSPWFQ